MFLTKLVVPSKYCSFAAKPLLFLEKIKIRTVDQTYADSKADIQFIICQAVHCREGGTCYCGQAILSPVLKSQDGFQKGKEISFSDLGNEKYAQFDFMNQFLGAKMLNDNDGWMGYVDFEFVDLNGYDYILNCNFAKMWVKLNTWTVTKRNWCSFNSK